MCKKHKIHKIIPTITLNSPTKFTKRWNQPPQPHTWVRNTKLTNHSHNHHQQSRQIHNSFKVNHHQQSHQSSQIIYNNTNRNPTKSTIHRLSKKRIAPNHTINNPKAKNRTSAAIADNDELEARALHWKLLHQKTANSQTRIIDNETERAKHGESKQKQGKTDHGGDRSLAGEDDRSSGLRRGGREFGIEECGVGVGSIYKGEGEVLGQHVTAMNRASFSSEGAGREVFGVLNYVFALLFILGKSETSRPWSLSTNQTTTRNIF